MITKYSKPSSDISIETSQFIETDNAMINQQTSKKINQKSIGERSECIICNFNILGIRTFDHRGTSYKSCKNCMHIQASEVLIDENLPNFDDIYPELEIKDWISRRDRIYAPKLNWVIDSLIKCGYDSDKLKKNRWLEFGSGAGYFLGALEKNGIENAIGIEENLSLVERSNQVLKINRTKSAEFFESEVMDPKVTIIASFFVLEHLYEPWKLLDIVSKKPKGTIFIFSIPSFGFTTLLEGMTNNFSARNLDGIVHRQVFTDESIEYLLKRMDYKKISEWIFGQDTLDLKRYFIKGIEGKFEHDPFLLNYIHEKIDKLIDPLQEKIDEAHFSDSRHIIAMKK